jgi:hypothetical protein
MMADSQDSGVSIHRRKRRRAAITLTVVGLMLVGTFAYAAAYFEGWVGTRAAKPVAAPVCPPVTHAAARAPALQPTAVTINVYNATNRKGLATAVAKSLRAQGFKVGKVANDPMRRQIAGVGEVRHGTAGTTRATLAATRLAGASLVADERSDDTVDLVLGSTFTVLSTPSKVVPPKVTKPSPSRPSGC